VNAEGAAPRGHDNETTVALLRKYVDFTRPFTLLPPTLGVVSGAVCAWGSYWNPDPARELTFGVVLTVTLGSLCAAFLNAASNVINQIYDLEVDRINKPQRMLPSGRISRRGAWIATWVLYALAVLPVWFVVIHPAEGFWDRLIAPSSAWPQDGGVLAWLATLAEWHAVFLIYIAGMLFTFVYSAPALGRTKRHAIGANVTIAIPRGMLLKVAGWGMVGPVLATEPWYIGLVFALFLVGAASTKDFSDMEGDRAGGCYTLPVRYGVRRAAFMIAPTFVLPWVLIPLGVFLRDPLDPGGEHAILTGNPVALVALGAGLMLWGLYTVWLILRDPEAMATMENHPSWTHMYLMMMTAQIGFAVAYLF
jgi:4-hydroxybenzoate polyprenyltransferase